MENRLFCPIVGYFESPMHLTFSIEINLYTLLYRNLILLKHVAVATLVSEAPFRAINCKWIIIQKSVERTSMIIAQSLLKWQIRHYLQLNSILFNFPCIPIRFDGQKHNGLVVAHVSADMTIRYAFWKQIRPPTVCSIFTPMEANHTFRHLDTCLTTLIATNTYIYTVDASKII